MKHERHEIRNLLLMLSTSFFVAFIFVVGLVYYFGSSGTYLMRDILVSPEALKTVLSSEGVKDEMYVFNKIEFIQADKQGKEWGRFSVSWESYAAFYRDVASQRSLPVVTDEIIAQFEQTTLSTLTIFVRSRDNAASESMNSPMIFQQVQFLDESDLFRVQLRSFDHRNAPVEEWAYFRKAGIYQKADKLFTPKLAS